MKRNLSRACGVIASRRGVSAAEYAILAVAVVVVVAAAALQLADPNKNAFAIVSGVISETISASQDFRDSN